MTKKEQSSRDQPSEKVMLIFLMEKVNKTSLKKQSDYLKNYLSSALEINYETKFI